MTGFTTLRYEVAGGLARLTLDRPEQRNGMTNQMVREATRALEMAAADDAVRVLVLTGAGGSFCPGADLHHFTSGAADERLDPRDFAVAALLHEVPAVTVAAINGACAGAGLGWALACDLRVMAATARLNTAFLDVAVAGDMGIPWSLPRIVGAARARDLSFLPRRVDAAEAAAIGLVARVFPAESFADDTEAVLAALLEKSPTALRGLKAHYLLAERMGFADFVGYEAERHLRIAASADTAEAFRAFLEKRKPNFG
ncbi:MAG TPA: enoyl-CoA hydratase-related protein [Acidimicrobiales bacterium]|nr:enoyl-CoA hydratase-related protein [Acidimicrobiales bacterium]